MSVEHRLTSFKVKYNHGMFHLWIQYDGKDKEDPSGIGT